MVINQPLISVSLKTLLAPSNKTKQLIKETPILTLFTVHVHVKITEMVGIRTSSGRSIMSLRQSINYVF